MRNQAFAIALVLVGIGCHRGGDGTGAPDVSVPTRGIFALVPLAGNVDLPVGAGPAPDSLRVVNSVGDSVCAAPPKCVLAMSRSSS